MLKRLFFAALFMAMATTAHASIASVGYLHSYITKTWDITLDHDASTNGNIVSVKYLMRQIDAANEMLNGRPTSDYVNDPKYAEQKIASGAFARYAVENLIKREIDPKFYFVPETDGTKFNFKISASGTFYINWGDGDVTEIDKQNTTDTTYSHTYEDGMNASDHTIVLSGVATGYNSSNSTAAISFYRSASDATYRVKSVAGCLSCVFPVISTDSKQYPRFYETFYKNVALTSLPDNLFAGITEVAGYMFRSTFGGCSAMQTIGNILPDLVGPEDLANYTFYQTFRDNTSLENTMLVGPEHKELWEMWPDGYQSTSPGTYQGDRQLPNYADIPTRWK